MLTWLTNVFRKYRHEGCEEVRPLPADLSNILPYDEAYVEEEPPYSHPYTIPYDDEEALINVYGDCGRRRLNKKWEKRNLVLVKGLPGYWNRKNKRNMRNNCRLYVHKKMAPALVEALRRCEVYEVLDYIEQMGCFKWRTKSTSSNLSTHSWAISVDINQRDNRLKRYRRGTAPVPWSDEWWEVWPKGVPELLVKAFKEAGFSWGGDWQTTPDCMHFQLTK